MRALLDYGSNPYMRDMKGHTPLHLAAKKDHASVVRAMLTAGVDPETSEAQDEPGCHDGGHLETSNCTAIRYAFKYEHSQPETAMAFVPFLKHNSLIQAVFWLLQKEDQPQWLR